jgi:hypothetical protein
LLPLGTVAHIFGVRLPKAFTPAVAQSAQGCAQTLGLITNE